jgi:hypothetical protein
MRIKATPVSAALAGVWSALGLVPLDNWAEHHQSVTALQYNLAFLAGVLVFLFAPGYLFVVGADAGPFSRAWFLRKEERGRYAVVVKRMLIWFFAAGVFGVVWSMAFDLFASGAGS